jgi:hypothetical protein
MEIMGQRVAVGNCARRELGDDQIKGLIARHLQTGGFEKPDCTWWILTDQDTGATWELIAETRWTDEDRTTLQTVCALATEWHDLTGEDPPTNPQPTH